ncbi:RDD family protein [Streptomyces sp. NBC_00588]|uniref:RDD family protein n=1 Tax=Streptomyces sp. NBC_00588 TaxID=2975784 RepID=UPI002E80D61B|nr:RDD family protein [Streptomyces sp. NBC_00588]WUB36263.1 RDD family protein [Streptomyces sp. NBC_00588]
MSAPTPAPGDNRPREGYYPDPSIPGYVRYWNGAAWVPGTSRPAPTDGESLMPPPGSNPAPVEETGPHFFDEDPQPGPSPSEAQHGSRPEPASAWGADRAHQSGFGGEQDRRVSWGAPQGADPRVPADPPAQPDGRAARTDGTATIPPADGGADDVASGGTFVFRRPTANPGGAAGSAAATGAKSGSGAPAARPADAATPGIPGPGGPVGDEGTMTFRAVSPRTGRQDAAQSGGTGKPGFGAGKAAAERASAAQAQPPAPAAPGPSGPQAAPTVPPQSSAPAAQTPAAQTPAAPPAPLTTGPGGGQSSWAQQVHRLAGAGEEQPVAPWRPPVEDVFTAAARRQSAARPAGLGKRLAARLLDTVVLAGVTAVAAVPLGTKALDHVDEKIDAAKLSGETVTVWLLDGTTSVYLGVVLAVLLVFGVLYEALPTAKWGRTLGKKLLGLQVRDIEAHEPPSFGGALRRWLVYSVPGLLVVGVVGIVWCLFDRPWHQCWHDKAAGTFVAG